MSTGETEGLEKVEKADGILDVSSLCTNVFERLGVDGEKRCENGSVDGNRKRILSKHSVNGVSAD